MNIAAATNLGPYDVIAPLGAGGMGEVYRARDTRLRREVALKVLPADVSADATRRARFEQEAHAATALNHPSILGVHDIGSDKGVFYIAPVLLRGSRWTPLRKWPFLGVHRGRPAIVAAAKQASRNDQTRPTEGWQDSTAEIVSR